MPRLFAVLLDLVLVVAFTIIGRATHGEAITIDGVLRTGAPFVAGTLLAIILLTLRRWRIDTIKGGLTIWLATVVLGMVFRFFIGDGIQVAFVVVTLLVLGAFLIGWRIIWLWMRREHRATRRGHAGPRSKDPRRSGNPAKRNPNP